MTKRVSDLRFNEGEDTPLIPKTPRGSQLPAAKEALKQGSSVQTPRGILKAVQPVASPPSLSDPKKECETFRREFISDNPRETPFESWSSKVIYPVQECKTVPVGHRICPIRNEKERAQFHRTEKQEAKQRAASYQTKSKDATCQEAAKAAQAQFEVHQAGEFVWAVVSSSMQTAIMDELEEQCNPKKVKRLEIDQEAMKVIHKGPNDVSVSVEMVWKATMDDDMICVGSSRFYFVMPSITPNQKSSVQGKLILGEFSQFAPNAKDRPESQPPSLGGSPGNTREEEVES